MRSARTILHADMDAFYAAVEQRDEPSLRGRPVIVGGLGNRGVVSTASYEARRFGVHSAMPTAIARRLCPHAVFRVPRMKVYVGVSKQVFEIFRSYTPMVEGLSLDEAFLDVTASRALFGDGPTIADRIRADVAEATGLTVSVGVASSKFVAKVASDLEKPDGLTVVPDGGEVAFLAPLPVSRLWGAGKKTQARLAEVGLHTIGDLQARREDELVRLLGEAAGRHFHRLAHARDPRSVNPRRGAKSISHETTFGEDLVDTEACHGVLLELSEAVGRRLRRHRLTGATVKLKLRFPPFVTLSRQAKLGAPTDDDMVIFRTVVELFDRARPEGRPVRLLGVGLSDLEAAGAAAQLDLFETEDPRPGQVLRTLDAIRDRFGESSIGHGSTRGGRRSHVWSEEIDEDDP